MNSCGGGGGGTFAHVYHLNNYIGWGFWDIRNNRDARQVLSAEAEDWGYNIATYKEITYIYTDGLTFLYYRFPLFRYSRY